MSSLPAASYDLRTLLAAWEDGLHAVVELGRRLTPEQEPEVLATIVRELGQGVTRTRDIWPAVTIFGSARFKPSSAHYKLARATGKAFAQAGFSVMTGGGPGIMEAGNRGAKEGGGRSIGCNIILPHEQSANRWCDEVVSFEYFFTRKAILRLRSVAFIVMPGGVGTLDECFEVMTLLQTGKLQGFPLIFMGVKFWRPLKPFFEDSMLVEGTVERKELHFAHYTDDPEEAVAIVEAAASSGTIKARSSKKSGRLDRPPQGRRNAR